MKTTFIKILFAAGAISVLASCSDDETKTEVKPIDETLNGTVLTGFSTNVAQPIYTTLASKTATLLQQVQALSPEATDNELEACRTTWKEARQSWEQSESFLFGPVSVDEIDPRIDTWPVNFQDLNAELDSKNEFTEDYINQLDDALKGFHPIEYLIFGVDGEKKASELDARQLQYLTALAVNLKELTADLETSWKPTTANSYHSAFTQAGAGSKEYPTQLAAFEELVSAMAGICDEVANGKIKEVYEQKNPSLEESPFSKNSITDFTNNIRGVENVYLGRYAADGEGLEDLVRAHNLQLDGEVKAKMTKAIQALGKITDPFGEAITSQAVQVETAIAAINDLQQSLENELLPFVQKHAK